jgi:hypothetical protein
LIVFLLVFALTTILARRIVVELALLVGLEEWFLATAQRAQIIGNARL